MSTENLFAQALDSAIRRAVEIAIEPLHLQIDVLKTEINQLQTRLTEANLFERTTNVNMQIDEAKLSDAVEDIITNNMDLTEFLDLGEIANQVLEEIDLEHHIRNVFNDANITFKMR